MLRFIRSSLKRKEEKLDKFDFGGIKCLQNQR